MHWTTAQLGKVKPILNLEIASLLIGHRYEEYFSHLWGHYEVMVSLITRVGNFVGAY